MRTYVGKIEQGAEHDLQEGLNEGAEEHVEEQTAESARETALAAGTPRSGLPEDQQNGNRRDQQKLDGEEDPRVVQQTVPFVA